MKRCFAALLALLLLTLAACGGRQEHSPSSAPDSAAAEPVPAPAPPPESVPSPEELAARAAAEEAARREQALRALLDGMSAEEKVGQLFFVRCPAAGAEEDIRTYHLGGVLLFGRDYQDGSGAWLGAEEFAAKLARYQAAAADTGVPLFIGSDEEGGTVTRASRNPNLFAARFPSPQQLFRSGGLDGLADATAAYCAALRTLGVNVNFAPVCDVSTDTDDFIFARSFGQDAAATAEYAARAVGAMRAAGMAATLKHFPGYGNNVDTHTGVAFDARPYAQFETEDFLPFAAGVAAGAEFVLVSHNVVACMDDALPASLSPAVHAVLRSALGFDGVILTDDLAMGAVAAYAKDGSAAVLAVLAGNDMLVTTDYKTQIPQVLAAVADGTVPPDTLDAAVLRVLRTKLALGLLEV